MKRIVCLIVVTLLLCCGCSAQQAEKSTNNNSTSVTTADTVNTFSYKKTCEYYKTETAGIKRTGFVNTKKSSIENSEQAISLAKNECTVDYDTIDVAYDSEEKVYEVSFFKENITGDNQDIYINQDGITQLIVYGE
ncbi:MAG: hypothetical protein UD936_08900 [Acutalibacteraceae bacterium]|nr:hypothetical protein [Acutalibacteraceae bacterium]